MDTALFITAIVVVIAGFLAFTGAIKAAAVTARFIFYIGVVVFLGLLAFFLLV